MGSRQVVAESVRWRRALETQEAAECRRWRPLSAAGKGEEWLWVRTSGVMVVRFSLVRATMTRSSEEMRAGRGESGEVLGGGVRVVRCSLMRATMTRSSEEMRA